LAPDDRSSPIASGPCGSGSSSGAAFVESSLIMPSRSLLPSRSGSSVRS